MILVGKRGDVMQKVNVKNVTEGTKTFQDVSIGQFFEWSNSLYVKLSNIVEGNNAWNISCKAPSYFEWEDKVKLVSEINIEYKL